MTIAPPASFPPSTPAARPLRVVIEARLRSGQTGGVESVIIGLASGISGLADGDDEYVFVVWEGEDEWLQSHVSGPARIVVVPHPRTLRRSLSRRAPRLAAAWLGRPGRRSTVAGPPRSDGTAEALRADVVHFVNQVGYLTDIPTIYHPHDLQHLHLPQFFTAEERAWRERWYRTLSEQAAMVAVASDWTRDDVIAEYGLASDKVVVVPWAPPTAAYAEPDEIDAAVRRSRLGVPDSYVLYPAQTWPHKNHIGLLRALARLRDREGVVVPLVAPGQRNAFFSEIAREVTDLGLGDQVVWPGFVSTTDLVALYAGATAVVIPSRFEAASAPLWEAFLAGVPAACSNVTSLPQQAGDAALVFDPDDVAAMAAAILRLWTDGDLRDRLVHRGRTQVAELQWDTTARLFRTHYRRLALGAAEPGVPAPLRGVA